MKTISNCKMRILECEGLPSLFKTPYLLGKRFANGASSLTF